MAQLDLLDIWLNSPMGTKLQYFNTNNDLPPSSASPFIAEQYDLLSSEYEASRTPPSINDGVISISHPLQSNYSWTFFYFAIPSTGIDKVTFDMKISNYSYSGCAGYFGIYNGDSSGNFTRINHSLIVASGTQHTGVANYVIDGNTWVSMEIDISDTNANYIMVGGWWGDYQFKNVKIHTTVSYTWQSVPSISGKNGILSLVTLDSEAINDGEPVSGAAVSVFDQAPSTDNNAKDLADTYGSGEESSAVDVTVKYKVTLPPGGAFSVLKLVAKKDSIPEDATDGDKIVDISPTKTKKTVTGLDENSMYYFKIFAEDNNSNTSESDEKHILTSGDEGYNFDYTGEIVEWTVPKTGIYSLETWGAQGGDATDGTNSARGGYGAYAYGEVLLTQGEKLYINVGGQNGYGGGGREPIIVDFEDLLKSTDLTHYVTGGDGSGSSIPTGFADYKNSDYFLFTSENYNAGFTLISVEDVIETKYNSAYGYILIPFVDTTEIIKVEFDIKINQSTTGNFAVALRSNNLDTVMLVYLQSITQKDWTHITYNVPSNEQNIVYNYFQFTSTHTKSWIKNVKFTIK